AAPARARKGFTLIELLVSLSVVAILAVLAVPAFRNMIAQSEIRAAATTLSVAMMRARSEATKRSATIRVLKKGGGWATGWEVQDPGNAVLAEQGALSGVTFSSAPSSVVYLSTGRVQGSPSDYRFTLKSTKIASIERCVSVDTSGSPSIKTTAC
ncbi:MAG: GspH/FimT family pseudopilin, partial [Panacagrimonas sp.]